MNPSSPNPVEAGMKDFYSAFYPAVEHSPAHALFCERVFGIDLSQHGFADLEQLELLLRAVPMEKGHRVLDVGCGNGRISEYLSDRTGAHFTGLDYIPAAVDLARKRTEAKSARLEFILGDINRLDLTPRSWDVILLIDSIYFSDDYQATIRNLTAALRPRGRMGIFYSYGREPWVAVEDFPKDKLPPGKTPLADALAANHLTFQTWDLTARDYELALRRKAVLEELKPQFEAEGALFIYENRHGDAEGISRAIADGLQARYFYQVGPIAEGLA
jgi:cyclopropane fatty-acyl-phospholipid synthase-like methyltransferase